MISTVRAEPSCPAQPSARGRVSTHSRNVRLPREASRRLGKVLEVGVPPHMHDAEKSALSRSARVPTARGRARATHDSPESSEGRMAMEQGGSRHSYLKAAVWHWISLGEPTCRYFREEVSFHSVSLREVSVRSDWGRQLTVDPPAAAAVA